MAAADAAAIPYRSLIVIATRRKDAATEVVVAALEAGVGDAMRETAEAGDTLQASVDHGYSARPSGLGRSRPQIRAVGISRPSTDVELPMA